MENKIDIPESVSKAAHAIAKENPIFLANISLFTTQIMFDDEMYDAIFDTLDIISIKQAIAILAVNKNIKLLDFVIKKLEPDYTMVLNTMIDADNTLGAALAAYYGGNRAVNLNKAIGSSNDTILDILTAEYPIATFEIIEPGWIKYGALEIEDPDKFIEKMKRIGCSDENMYKFAINNGWLNMIDRLISNIPADRINELSDKIFEVGDYKILRKLVKSGKLDLNKAAERCAWYGHAFLVDYLVNKGAKEPEINLENAAKRCDIAILAGKEFQLPEDAHPLIAIIKPELTSYDYKYVEHD